MTVKASSMTGSSSPNDQNPFSPICPYKVPIGIDYGVRVDEVVAMCVPRFHEPDVGARAVDDSLKPGHFGYVHYPIGVHPGPRDYPGRTRDTACTGQSAREYQRQHHCDCDLFSILHVLSHSSTYRNCRTIGDPARAAGASRHIAPALENGTAEFVRMGGMLS